MKSDILLFALENTTRLNLYLFWANSADDKLMICFLSFPRQQDLTFHANHLPWRQFA